MLLRTCDGVHVTANMWLRTCDCLHVAARTCEQVVNNYKEVPVEVERVIEVCVCVCVCVFARALSFFLPLSSTSLAVTFPLRSPTSSARVRTHPNTLNPKPSTLTLNPKP